MKSNESGITLIEVLVTLVIISIVGAVIWNVFIQGNKISQKTTSKNLMIQETNILISNLKNIHQKTDSYTISQSTPCEISIHVPGQQDYVFSSSNLCFKYQITNGASNNVNPNTNDVGIQIITSDAKNNKVVVDTILYRLKSGGL